MLKTPRNQIIKLLAFIVATTALSRGVPADDLYNAALNSPPETQGWLRLSAATGCGVPPTISAAGLSVNTLADAGIYCGYFSHSPSASLPFASHPLVGTLNRNQGFSLRFSLRVAGETHITPERGGFSLIVVSADLAAIELAFWESEIWAYDFNLQTTEFSHAEGLLLDTRVKRDYELRILGDKYKLLTGGVTLEGQLRDYSGWPGLTLVNGVTVQPYRVANLLFFGDDTSSAGARFELTTLSLESTGGTAVIFNDGFE